MLSKKEQPDRLHINMYASDIKHWTRALGVSEEELRKAVDKVGSSAVAVRKELGIEWSDPDGPETETLAVKPQNAPERHVTKPRFCRKVQFVTR
ncbi:DUF3606 domain-containing protein [Bradyrhizobium sp. Arg68]|uniref:DUF3606 domain-containing protein n=1 Tax=Bradyrhizobium ivorense TaxID=2511166 RepID=UPI0035588E13|nr:DUF3606 domain-containing protein [Bradyrhizobium ivorense]